MASRFLRFSVLLQKYRTPVLIASCGGVFTANLFYHVFPDASFRPLYQAWYKGAPVTLSKKLENVFLQVVITFCTLHSMLNSVVILYTKLNLYSELQLIQNTTLHRN